MRYLRELMGRRWDLVCQKVSGLEKERGLEEESGLLFEGMSP